MPRHSRRQCRLRPAEHGGTCPQEDERAKGLKGKEAPPYIEEEQDCKLAPEHCMNEDVNPLWKDQFKVSGGGCRCTLQDGNWAGALCRCRATGEITPIIAPWVNCPLSGNRPMG